MVVNWILALTACVISFSCVESSLVVSTNSNVTAYRGEEIRLPCRFEGKPTAVYWHSQKPTLMTVSDNDPVPVVTYFEGRVYSSSNGSRFEMTSDYSMVISDVQVGDETSYSCTVVLEDDSTGKNYTDLSVIALASPLYPAVTECEETEPGKCVYEVKGEVAGSETFPMRCRVENIKPAVSLSWTAQDGEERTPPPGTVVGPDGDGLLTITSELQVSRTEIGETFICKATGESVNGTSTLLATVKYPPKKGLSSGEKAAVAIVVLIIIVIAAGGVIYFLWRKKKREQEIDGEQMEPLTPFQKEFNELAEKIRNYKPGAFSQLEDEVGRDLPDVTRLGVFGVTHAGKSSLVRSLTYSLKGEFIAVEVAQSHSIGGVTVVPKKFAITKHISVVDNRGLKDLDVSSINGIMEQIRGTSKLLEGTVDFPILVFDARQPVNALEKFLPDFVKAIRTEFGSHPAIVFTHRDNVLERLDTIKAQATGMGALDQKLYFVENFTAEPTGPCFEQRLEFLKILKKMLECADENHIMRDNKKSQGNGPSKFVQIDEADSSRSKGLLRFFNKK